MLVSHRDARVLDGRLKRFAIAALAVNLQTVASKKLVNE